MGDILMYMHILYKNRKKEKILLIFLWDKQNFLKDKVLEKILKIVYNFLPSEKEKKYVSK